MKWLRILDVRDLARPVSLIVRLVQNSRNFADGLVKEGLLDSTVLHKLLGKTSPKEVIMDVLVLISDLARLSKVCNF
jgi:fused-like protein